MPKRGRESSNKLMAIEISKFNELSPDERNRLGTPVRTTRSIYYFKNDDASNVDDLVDMIGSLRLTPNDIIVVPPVVADNIINSQDNEADTDAQMENMMSGMTGMTINGGKRSRRKSRRRKTKRARKSRRRRTHRRKRR